MDAHEPLHLAQAVNDMPFMDGDLSDTQHFFQSPPPEDEADAHHQQQQHDLPEVPGSGLGENRPLTQEEINAAIKQSILKAPDHVRDEMDHENDLGDGSELVTSSGIEADAQHHGPTPTLNSPIPTGHDRNDVSVAGPSGHEPLGSEHNPIYNPTVYMAPFSKPERSQEDTPQPAYYVFDNRQAFNAWLDGEGSWCHFVQRRSTTPDKRSQERLQTRMAKHNKKLEGMSEEERKLALPLKTRRRNRVSPVAEKVTFTCHHAGTYNSQHSSNLPKEKLRMNTKKSVKCACPSRIVLSEMQSGDCRVCYHWKHEGHDPFTEGDLDGGRMNKAIDEWMVARINEGKTPEEIRRLLDMDEDAKKAYLDKVAADPSQIDPNLPPPVALVRETKFRYSEIYNRFRKLKGPIKETKQQKAATASGSKKAGKGKRKAGDLDAIPSPTPTSDGPELLGDSSKRARVDGPDPNMFIDPSLQSPNSLARAQAAAEHTQTDALDAISHAANAVADTGHHHHLHHIPSHDEHGHEHGHSHGEGDNEDEYASLAAPHESLARALLSLPGAANSSNHPSTMGTAATAAGNVNPDGNLHSTGAGTGIGVDLGHGSALGHGHDAHHQGQAQGQKDEDLEAMTLEEAMSFEEAMRRLAGEVAGVGEEGEGEGEGGIEMGMEM
ncbi:hypothetical protein B9479_002183 [Cryptococcus floricola]|uniref:Uncharacterized protein n=1 Tax=Cryptococcus floricola TaxID=2591691 RepID=A0A5D3B1X2_9TREE|nr:hypothetical protein B9479_002183 [Cryptococcus floricola]